MTGSEAVSIVQFPHPGPEHDATAAVGGVFPWNDGPHKRKFLQADGSWHGEGDQQGSGAMRFWGEYEPPSRVTALGPKEGQQPRFLHEPLYPPSSSEERQNTDPLVLGGFWYSNCKQHQYNDKDSPTKMQGLTRGSVILFGSMLNHGFVLDTVFVVARATAYARSDLAGLDVPQHVREMALDPMNSTPSECMKFTLYDGATADAPVDGRYSFVPAIPAEDSRGRFERPQLHLSDPELLDLQLSQGTKRTFRTEPEAAAIWQEVRDQIWGEGLVLGTFLAPPAVDTAPGQEPEVRRRGGTRAVC